MGGETIIPSTFTSEDESSLDQDFPLPSSSSQNPTLIRDGLRMKVEDGKDEFDKMGPQFSSSSSSSLESEFYNKRRQKVYKEVLESYDQLQARSTSLTEAKNKVLSYVPGAWIEKAAGMKLSDYDVPERTSLLLIGPKGCGKSSLVNRIFRVFEADYFAPDRAQVSHYSSAGEGTYYLQGYMIPRGSASFCLYDTRGLSNETFENINMIKSWMKKGVRHGELIIRKSDDSSLRKRMKSKTRGLGWLSCKIDTINFVIFVVDAVSILKSMEGDGLAKAQYKQMITEVFKCPCLSFKDDKPVVVITHGDLLSLADRIRVRVHLGELLGIASAKQIFDIPENQDPVTELTIIDMLRYALEHADRNLPHKSWVMENVRKVRPSTWIHVLEMLIVIMIALTLVCMRPWNMKHPHKPAPHIWWQWHGRQGIRHVW